MSVYKIETPSDIKRFSNGLAYYVYVLRAPDGVRTHGVSGAPFYVGLGQGTRIFDHEVEAKESVSCSPKHTTIGNIWAAGGAVCREISSFYDHWPALEEADLIRQIGTLKDGTGPLTNSQTYFPSNFLDGMVTRKYLDRVIAAGGVDVLPSDFSLTYVRLQPGRIRPTNLRSVAGMIYEAVERFKGETGAEIHARLMEKDFSHIRSPYVVKGSVCAIWLADWMHGAFWYKKCQHIEALS